MKNILIIGAGLAGTLISNELAGKCNVTLLEAGKKDHFEYPKIEYLNMHLGQVKTFCNGEGGTTNLWHNGLIPMREEDITTMDFRNILIESNKYRNKAAKKLFWRNNPYDMEFEKIYSEMKKISDEIGVFSDGIDCLLYPKKYQKLIPDTRVNVFYSVDNINFTILDNKINSINFYSQSGNHRINFDNLIISAGALGSPILVKNILSQFGIPSDSVGKGFADHPMGFVGKVKLKKNVNSFLKKFAVLDKGHYISRTAIRLKSDCGAYTSAAFLRPALSMNNKLSLYKYKSVLGASRGIDRIKNIFSFKILHVDIIAEIVSHLFGINIPGRVYNIMFINDQKRGKSNVSYDKDGIVLDWSISGDELMIYNKMLKKLKKILSPISEEININTNLTEEWLWSGAHHSGTISLGDSPTDILDKDLKLKTIDNVFVCDGSVIQEHSYANTGLTIGQLAMRLVNSLLN